MKYLGLCCIVKDETPFLEEWIAYHTLLGVESFFIYDNGSRTPVAETLSRLLEPGYITVYSVPGRAKQIPCYNHCLTEHGKRFAWLGFLDMDEFATPLKTGDLRVMLTEFEPWAGFGANWMPFGCGGHSARPAGLQIENYTLSMPSWDAMTRHVKLFVQPGRVTRFINPHIAVPVDGPIVNERREPVCGAFSWPPSWELCQINHYYYRSRQDYYQKLRRSMADSVRRHHMPHKVTPPDGDTPDFSAARHAPAVRSLLRRGEEGACAMLARRPEVPESPAAALTQVGELLRAWRLEDALVLLCKARMAFPRHPLLEEVAQCSRSLLEQARTDQETSGPE